MAGHVEASLTLHLDRLLPNFPDNNGRLKCRLPPGLLPSGLRMLLMSREQNPPLQLHCLPSTLTFLHLGPRFDQPIAPGVLRASLRYMSVAGPLQHHHQLLQGSLPASLERLKLTHWPHPLEAGVWPAGLKALHVGGFSHSLQPHVLPSSLLYLCFTSFHQPLLPDVLPSALVELHLGDRYDYPLLPGALPRSVRRFTLGSGFSQQLQARSLPEELLFLRFIPGPNNLPPLQPGVLPSTLLGVDLTDRHTHPLPAGVIPSSVRWVRLYSRYRHEHVEAVLPAQAECVWYSDLYYE